MDHRRCLRSRCCVLLAVPVTLLVWPTPAESDWFDPDWSHRKRITVDAAKVPNTDQLNFPLLISRTDPDWRDVANGGHVGKINGGDLLFTSADGSTQLDHDIERYDPITGEVIAWINVPTLSASVDTDLYIYYGSPSAADQADTSGTWSNGFVGVWHLNEDPTGSGPQMRDRTGNGNHGTVEATVASTVSTVGKIGNAWGFDGTDDLVRVLDSVSLDGTNDAATMELWINWKNAADGIHQIVMTSSNRFTAASEDGYEWASQGDGDHFFYPWSGNPVNNYNLGLNPFTNGQYHHVAVTMEWGTKDVKIYVDGTPMAFTFSGVPTFWIQLASPDDWLWAGNPDRPTRGFDGEMDEVRVSDVVRTADWIQTCVNNQSAPATFYSVGAEEQQLVLVKRAFTFDGTPIVDMSTVARGALVKYLIYINGRTGAVSDVSARDVLDPAFEYQAGTLKVNNATDACVELPCTPAEETIIFSDVDAQPISTDAIDVDVVSITGNVIDAGDRFVANGQLDIAAGKVWALLFTVRVR